MHRLFKCAFSLFVIWIVASADIIHPSSTTARQEQNPACDPNVSEGEKRLLDAIQSGNAKQVEALLAAGANPDGKARINADPYSGVKICHSPLMHALRLGKTEILKLLLTASHAKDNSEVYSAELAHDRDVIEMLIAGGGDVNARDDIGNTPLILAAKHGRASLARLLLAQGADLNLQNKSGQTALTAAIGGIGYDSSSDADRDKVIEVLVAAGQDINAADSHSNTPLILAAGLGRADLARFLLEHGADLNRRNKFGQTALMTAAFPSSQPEINKNKAKIIGLLARDKSDANAKDAEGNTLLMSAARYGWQVNADDTIVQALLSSGADVNARNNNGDTALIDLLKIRSRAFASSVAGGNHVHVLNTIQILVDAGADVNAENHKGDTPLKMAVGSMRSDSGQMVALNALIEHRANVNLTGSAGEPALLLAIRRAAGRSDSEVVQALIKAGADVNITDEEGTPALIVAVRESGNVEVIRLLLEAGARVNHKDQSGDTALIAAVRQYLPSNNETVKNTLYRNPQVVRALLAAGSDIALKGKGGITVFDLAGKINHRNIIQMLRVAKAKRK